MVWTSKLSFISFLDWCGDYNVKVAVQLVWITTWPNLIVNSIKWLFYDESVNNSAQALIVQVLHCHITCHTEKNLMQDLKIEQKHLSIAKMAILQKGLPA